MNNMHQIEDDKWLQLLLKSINNRVVDGIKFPSFPADDIQAQFVGSSNESALREGFEFYKLVKGYASALAKPLNKDTSRFLDFGCGWGRYLRFFWKDIAENNLFGVDIDPSILEGCKQNDVPGNLSQIFPDGQLPYPDGYFDCVIAYSVFTHLPENVHKHWVDEISRVSKPGCVFVSTLESSRFLDFIGTLDPLNPESGWHKGLSQYTSQVSAYRQAYENGEFVYLPTGGGDYRSSEVYGDAIIPKSYIETHWSSAFNIIDYIDDRFWQAILVVQKK